MTSTYRSSPQYVTDGDTTSHTTPENINVQSAEIRWQGVSGYPQSKTRPTESVDNRDRETHYIDKSGSISTSMPSRPSGTSYKSSLLAVDLIDDVKVDIDIVAPDGTTVISERLEERDTEVYRWSNASTDGNNVTLNLSSTSDFEVKMPYRETTGTYDTKGGNGHSTRSNSKSHSFSDKDDSFSLTLSPSFPSVPQEVLEYLVTIDHEAGTTGGQWGSNFYVDYVDDGTEDFHGYVLLSQNGKEWGGPSEDVTYHIPKDVAGSDAPVDFFIEPSYDSNGSITVSAETRYVEVTKEPSVSGDVSATYSGASNLRLADGEWSDWQSLDGFSEGTNEFIHSIEQSGEANFEFKYTYEYLGPDAVAIVRVQHDDGVYDLTLADPSDTQLENNSLRVNVNNETLAADLVEPSDPNATPVRVHVPNYGTLAWRKNL